MNYWQAILLLSGLAGLFILWPLSYQWLRRRTDDGAEVRKAANTQLYDEHIRELRQQLDNGDITDDQFEALQLEQQRALLEDVTAQPTARYRRSGTPLLVVFALLTPVMGWLMYEQMGARDDWQLHQAVTDWQTGERQGEEFERRLRHDLARRLEERPNNTQNWYLLAKLAMNVQDYDQAVAAFRRIIELQPQSPRIMAELAQALFLQAGNHVTPEVRRYTQQALELEPRMPTALGLAGIDAFQQGYFQKAIDYWSRAVDLLGEDAPGAQALISGIGRAQAELEERGEVVAEPASAEGPAITAEVALGEGVEVDPNATVFVFARAFEGPPMPLAIQRFPASDLPRTVRLDESMAMAPGMSLSQFKQLEVVARVSRSGIAVPQSGDWQAVVGPVTLGQEGVGLELTISKQLP